MAISQNNNFLWLLGKNLFCIPTWETWLLGHIAITGNFVLCSSRFLMGWLYRMPNEAWEIEEKRRRRDANGMIPDIKLLFKMLLTVAPPNSGNRSQVYNPKGLLFFYELRRAYIKHRCATSRAFLCEAVARRPARPAELASRKWPRGHRSSSDSNSQLR